ncbi:hypothetical protein [Streptomyces sp. NPDC048527]|uniref:hypothetical protein n=1 Tax=Streptomyces sp. NPDC048527 TaxID=3365568 RepID=UPI00371D548A
MNANALAEPTIDLSKTELIKPGRPWKTLSQVDLAATEWVDWYCRRRFHGEIGHISARRIRSQLQPQKSNAQSRQL